MKRINYYNSMFYLKFALYRFGKYICTILIRSDSEIYIFFSQVNKKLFSEENKVPRTLFEAKKVAGSTTYKQSQQYKCVVL